MKLISHRGNLLGGNPEQENNPNYVLNAINQGFDVEIDVWFNGNFFLGHDFPQYEVSIEFLKNPKLWCHAKNSDALSLMLEGNIHCFFHDTDLYTITSQGIIWGYVNTLVYSNSVCVMPEIGYKGDIKNCYGICSDFIINYV